MDTRTFRVTMVVSLQVTLVFGLLVASMSCANRTLGVTRSSRTAGTESRRPLGLDLYRPEPADNPTLPSTVTLGRRLFHERRLSRDRSLACVDCHRPDRAFTDGRARAVGVYGRRGPRSVPTIVNRAWGESFFWDGRIDTLEAQVLEPIVARLEMDLTIDEAVERLRGTSPYPAMFRETFGRDVNRDDLARALAAYVRSIQSGDSPFDRYIWGEPAALSPEAQEGLRLFRGRANCTVCHVGPNFTDEEFHNTGVFWGGQPYDAGRAVVTGVPEDTGKFPARGSPDRALHARRQHCHARRGRRLLRPGWQRQSLPGPGAAPATADRGREDVPRGLLAESQWHHSRGPGVTSDNV